MISGNKGFGDDRQLETYVFNAMCFSDSSLCICWIGAGQNMVNFDDWIELNEGVVKGFANAFDINYHRDEIELKKLFLHEQLLTDEIIHKRVKTLNVLYHTHLWQENIIDIEQFLIQGGEVFESKILSGNMDTVAALADRNNRNCFVFATKYCSFVNPDEYPIYDSLVSNVLYYLHNRKPLLEGKLSFEMIRQNRDYKTFKDIVDMFKKQYGLENCSYREIDKFLWLVGKNM